MADVEIRGADTVIAGLGRLLDTLPQAVAGALYREAEAIMADSKTLYVPVDMGTLRDSGVVAQPEIGDGVVSVTMGYGGAASAYAVAVHEHPSLHDPPSWRKAGTVHFTVGGPKYLERPFLEHAKDLDSRLADQLASVLGG